MIFIMILGLVAAQLDCQKLCCEGICADGCTRYIEEISCPETRLELQTSFGKECMKQFLLAETEIRNLIYYIKFYSVSEIFQQLKVVLKVLPMLNAECYTFFEGF
ncbi:hypothetical protein SteCoe_29991 [Stentor coeruleus]|uniref:Saposin B-type domain-containing protein n=1 Tax=Stentor coeruleus TaxID=5963 RepID=A0A1R2B4Q4_9CILI|nr:hypothetical protein SteCoe_29991 [Stentor coeruleus]